MITNTSGMRIGLFNVRGLAKRLQTVDGLAGGTMIFGICETWIREKDDALVKALDVTAEPSGLKAEQRGYGGVAMIINPLLPYEMIDKIATATTQAVTVKINNMTCSTAYISPRAKKHEENEILQRLNKISATSAIIIGDLNARHPSWDVKGNARGARLKKWALKHNWSIKAPEHPTFISQKGTSNPDIFLTRGMETSAPEVNGAYGNGGSDHIPTFITVTPTQPDHRHENRSHIPRRQRNNPAWVNRAKEHFEKNLPTILGQMGSISDITTLEKAYAGFKETILAPWERARRRKPKRYSSFWNDTLDTMAKERKRLYRRSLVDNSSEWKVKYKEVDKKIKKLAKKYRENQRKHILQRLTEEKNVHEIRGIERLWQPSRETTESEEHYLDRAAFTKHMSTPKEEGWTPEILTFTIDETHVKMLEEAIITAPKNKATGADQIFVEALKVDAKRTSQIIAAFWKCCGELKYMLNDWSRAILVPIYKTGERADPQSYRPIALLSHVRKVVEATIAKIIRRQYTFRDSQLGFRHGTGTETALVRHISNSRQLKETAVLDLKGAYDSVPRNRLCQTLKNRVDHNTLNMINLTLQTVNIKTQGDESGHEGQVSKGVCQGSPLSPTLFNVYMDTFEEWLIGHLQTSGQDIRGLREKWNVTLFADDVKLQAQNPALLQQLLVAATEWAEAYGMTWSIRKCAILKRSDNTTEQKQEMNGEELELRSEAKYLGISATANGTGSGTNIKRLRAASRLLQMMKRKGLHSGTTPTNTILKIWQTYVLPKCTYGVHLVPLDEDMKKEWNMTEQTLMVMAMGCFSPRTRKRLRQIGNILSLEEQRKVSMTSLQKRISEGSAPQREPTTTQRDTEKFREVRNILEYNATCTKNDIQVERQQDEARRIRRLPKITLAKAPQALGLHNARIRRAAIQWYCGTFPRLGIRDHTERNKDREKMDQLKTLMSKKNWSGEEKDSTVSLLKYFKEREASSN